jgi:iron complex outermembrane receptor protein/hemoglobin/transferrin/lactoferrin receptor protein
MPRLPALVLMLAWPAVAWAQGYGTLVRGGSDGGFPEERAVSTVSRAEIERRQPRSAPDALRWEPGVYVQQTAHGQASAYLRGLTGQQTVLLFDGIRVNNSTYRQGPNQYAFTIDAQTLERIEVLRGGGSTRYGSDALGGVIAAYPIEPFLVSQGAAFRPRLIGAFTTADSERGGRAEFMLSAALGRSASLGFYGGAGWREVGPLQSAGPLQNPAYGQHPAIPRYPDVPRYARDGRTQLGTGFGEITADGRLVLQASPSHRLTLASYHYLQRDVPRTDQCPPPTAPVGECLTYEEQFRHLSYLAWDADLGPAARGLRLAVSHQRQHERLRYENQGSFFLRRGEDDVDTLGLMMRAHTDPLRQKGVRVSLVLSYGLDLYLDLVRSRLRRLFTDTGEERELPRGQYADGSSYLTGGAYLDGELRLPARVTLRGGVRYGLSWAKVPSQPESGTAPVDRGWSPVVGHLGAEWRPDRRGWLRLRANVDVSYRAPNLNDLSARLQTGPGFQFENANLDAERATTFEVGALLRTPYVHADVWAFETLISGGVLKVSQLAPTCPQQTPQCASSWARFQLQNAPALGEVRGVEGVVRVFLPAGLSLRATLAYAWGEEPRVGEVAEGVVGVLLGERVPRSRIPPLNGTVEARFAPGRARGLELSAGLRWADAQYRLAVADLSDGRIPRYGTPGFAVLDLGVYYRVDARLSFGARMENVTDAIYRYHGSSINGPGRGLLLNLKLL